MYVAFTFILSQYDQIREVDNIWLKKVEDRDIMLKKQGMRIDIMNRNTIISLAMLYALWQSNRQDLLDLIRPFVLYAVGNTTKVGSEIDIPQICSFMEKEFGYKSIQPAVINRIFVREVSSKNLKGNHRIEKRDGHFILISSLSDLIDNFSTRRTTCKSRSDAVTTALTDFLNQKQVCRRNDYIQADSERFLLSFFGKQGGAIILSVDDLRQLKAKSNEIDFFIGRFILYQYEQKSVLFDYLVELVKGYFVTTALYLQAENPNVTTAAFKDVTFYLDTRLLLAYLGFKTKEENESVQEMVRSLQKNGAKLSCFSYNIEEVDSILEAYKQATVSRRKHPSTVTLEYFDEHGYHYTHVDAAQKKFQQRLNSGMIKSTSPQKLLAESSALENTLGLLNDARVQEIILAIKPKYNVSTLPDDLKAVNAVSRSRQGKKYSYIEKCPAVFVTSNSVLVAAIKQHIKELSFDIGFPIAITDEDLCVLAWLKDFEQSNSLPQMRLLENVLAAITPSKELMDDYFSHLENLEKQGVIDEDEVALLRVDIFAKQELMELTYGEKENLNNSVINKIRERIQEKAILKERTDAEKRFEEETRINRNRICKRAEKEIDNEFLIKENRWCGIIKFLSIAVAIIFIIASFIVFASQLNDIIQWPIFVVTLVTTIEGTLPLFSKDNFLTKCCKKYLQRKKLQALDDRKDKYLSLLDIVDDPS